MATMLAYVVIDAKIPSNELQLMFRESVERSFNMVTVDGDTSTNDMAVVLSTGANEIDTSNAEARAAYQELLDDVCIELAKDIARDGEGAEKLLEVKVSGAETVADAKNIALSIANSPLVKTAVHGANPNWGRVLVAAGNVTGASVDPSKVDVTFGEVPAMKAGTPLQFSWDDGVKALSGKNCVIHVNLNVGEKQSSAWGCDLTKGYVDINVEYN